jgi:DNA-binding PadR family transcriptional regulator
VTDAELTILSLVAEGSRYGHEIQAIIDKRGLREWLTIGFASVFYILNRLEKQNLIMSEGHHPTQKSYMLTEGGRGVLQTAVSDLLRQPHTLGTGFELGLANLRALKPQQVYVALTYRRYELRRRLEAVDASWGRRKDQAGDHLRALYTHSIALMQSELAWLDEFLTDWQSRYPVIETVQAGEPQQPTRHHLQESSDPALMLQRLEDPVTDDDQK